MSEEVNATFKAMLNWIESIDQEVPYITNGQSGSG